MLPRLRSVLGVALIVFCSLATTVSSDEEEPKNTNEFSRKWKNSEGVELDDTNDLEVWPFHKKNKTHVDTSCSSHKGCYDCSTSSSFCHWCSHDNACHAKGSVHGCIEGETCVPQPDKENSTCYSHATCSDCDLSSSLCHWCAHDNACHAVGSLYGCMSGVDCYSNDRCQRNGPEEITGVFINDIGIAPLAIIFALAFTCCCCATLCFCAASGFKGAYDDIVVVAAGSSVNGSLMGGPVTYARHTDVIMTPTIQEDEDEDAVEEDEDDEENVDNANTDEEVGASREEEQSPAEETEEEYYPETNITEEAALLESHIEYQDAHDSYSLMTGAISVQPSAYDAVRERGGSNSMQSIFNLCRLCYAITLISIVGFIALSIRCFPKKPIYNVCNDNLAWKSLVDNMASLKAEAPIEILISVMNPNHFGVDVDMGRGSFKHKGVFVGTFDIPPTDVPPMAIIDVLVVAHFTPATWQAMSLSSEYYHGTLAFDIDAKANFRFPWLFDYAMSGSFNNIHVLVNDPMMKDRHLCACPSWEEAKNKTVAIF